MPPRTLLSSEQRTRLFAIPTDPTEMARHYVLDADDLALVGSEASREQSAGIRRSVVRASPSRWRAGPVGVAARTYARLRRETNRGRFGTVRRLRAAGPDPPRTCRRVAKISVTAAFRFCGLAHLPSCWHRRGVGHGSRRTHRPGDARPSAIEQGSPPGGGGAGANRVGCPCTRTKEDFRDARCRIIRCGAGNTHGVARGRSGIAPLALRLAAGLFGVARAIQHRCAAGSP